jgi:hypothetical protein
MRTQVGGMSFECAAKRNLLSDERAPMVGKGQL